MANWDEVERDAPDFAARVRERFEAGTNKTLATLRRDGSPRISGTELRIADGQVTLGMMADSVKLVDVRRDPRVALHSPTLEPPPGSEEKWVGDAKMSGRLVEVDPPAGGPIPGAGYFRLDIAEVALTYLGGDPPDHLVIESWRAGAGWLRRTRQ